MLSPDEKAACLLNGALLAGYAAKVPVSVLAEALCTEKSADGGVLGGAADDTMKALVIGSIGTGVPMGILSHIIGRRIKARSDKEKQLEATRDYYFNTNKNLESRFAGLA